MAEDVYVFLQNHKTIFPGVFFSSSNTMKVHIKYYFKRELSIENGMIKNRFPYLLTTAAILDIKSYRYRQQC